MFTKEEAMKFVHIADMHFDSPFTSLGRIEGLSDIRRLEQRKNLGVSSMQIDNPERGFSYKYDGPLDLRLNPEAGISAAERLRTVARDELEGMLIENADEPYAKEISQVVTRALRKVNKIDTTFSNT